MRRVWPSIAWFFFFAAMAGVSQWRIQRQFQWPYPTLNELSPSENYAQDLGALFLGAHRLAADLAYIQFLQYYGVAEAEDESSYLHGVHDEYGSGHYPQLYEHALRYLRLDPFFNGAILEAAGALAFNVKRVDQALSYLREAIDRDPTYYRYQLYVAAILFRQSGQEEKLIEKLEEAIKFPDCPPLLQGVLGNLLKKYGRYDEAAQVFMHTYQTAASESERQVARTRLEKLFEEHPGVLKSLGYNSNL